MRKRLIVVPKAHVAEDDLNYDRQSENQIIEYSLSEKEAKILYRIGVFDCINSIANTLIDDFEEDWITDQKVMSEVLSQLICIRNKHKELSVKEAVLVLITAFRQACHRKTGIYFYF